MKKSRQSSNDILAGGNIRRLFTVPMIICIVIFALSLLSDIFFSPGTYWYGDEVSGLIPMLKSEALSLTRKYYTPCYYLSIGYAASGIELFAGLIFAVLQFNFLLNKKSCYTQLSFAVGRRQLYFNKVFFPVMIAASITVALKVLAAIFNAFYLGLSFNLVIGVIVNILTTFAPFLEGYAIGVIGHMFTARKPEAYLLIASIMTLPQAISGVLENIFSHTLYGYDAMNSFVFDTITTELSSYSYSIASSDCFPIFEKTDFLPEFIYATVCILISVLALVLCKIYFINRFKAEQSGVRGKSRVALVLSCITLPLLLVNSYGLFAEYLSDNSYPFAPVFIIGIILSAILSIIFCLVVTWSPKKIAYGATAAGIGIALQLAVMVIGFTGGFGYATRVPDVKEIESVNITLPFEDMGYVNLENEFFSSAWSYGETITLTEEYEFEIAHNIHKAVIDNRSEDTGVRLEVYYTMKDGKTLARSYSNISETALDEFMNIWEAQEIKDRLGVILNVLDAKELYESKQSDTPASDSYSFGYYYNYESDFDYSSYYPSSISLYKETSIISKDYNVTKISSFYDSVHSEDYEAFNKELMEALYKDACTLSAEEWFKPEKELGVIAFEDTTSIRDAAKTLNMFGYTFYVNSDMTNTLKVLDKYGYTKYFETKKQIEKAHLADIEEVTRWMQVDLTYVYGEQEGHLPYFAQNNPYIIDYLTECGYCNISSYEDEWYYDEYDTYSYLDGLLGSEEIPSPKQEEITDLATAQKLFDEAFMAYNVGNDGKFLVVKYTDGTGSMLVIPNKTK